MPYIFNDQNNAAFDSTIQQTIIVDGPVNIPAGTYVPNISFKCAVNEVINVGTTPGNNDLIDSIEVIANITRDSILNTTFDVDSVIYFSGIVAPTTIKIYRR